MIYKELRRTFHKAMTSGQTPEQIALAHNLLELDVVQTLRNPEPKIRGANYTHLKVPVPLDEIIEAYHTDSLVELGELYGVTKTTLYNRLPKELRRTKPCKQKRKINKMTEVDKTEVVNRYYRSGRKFNACGVSTPMAKEILEGEGINIKERGNGNPINTKSQLALLDCLIESTTQNVISPTQLFRLHRLSYEFLGDDPQVWKGQLLDWLLNETITHELVICFNQAIDKLETLKGY